MENRNSKFWFCVFSFVCFAVAFLFGAGAVRETALRDGFVLTGVDGKLTSADSKWFFEFDSDVSDDRGRIYAGTRLELLPSATLEKMTADAKSRYIGTAASPVVRSKSPGATVMPSVQTSNGASYRLWGRVTKYRGKNFIFGIYFLPLSEVGTPFRNMSRNGSPVKQLKAPTLRQQETKLTINEPNDVLIIPEEIIAKLAIRRTIRPQQLRKGLELKQDFILADRTGFITRQADNSKFKIQNSKFIFDALGRNLQQVRLNLLACEALERAERQQSAEPEPLRFKIAGIVTKYKGEYYLLLQRATRVYSHSNFGK